MPPHARAGEDGRGHRFAAYPRCSADTGGDRDGMTKRLWGRRSVGCGAALALLLVVAGAFDLWLNSGIVRRRARVVEDISSYGAELVCLDPSAGSVEPNVRGEPGSTGTYAVRSPDGRFTAVTLSWHDRSPLLSRHIAAVLSLFVGFISDAPVTHTIAIRSASDGRLRSVVSVKEADPFSGYSHQYSWSADSRALLIYGAGGLPEAPDEPVGLCLVYLPATDDLVRLRQCPGLNEVHGPTSEACRRTRG